MKKYVFGKLTDRGWKKDLAIVSYLLVSEALIELVHMLE